MPGWDFIRDVRPSVISPPSSCCRQNASQSGSAGGGGGGEEMGGWGGMGGMGALRGLRCGFAPQCRFLYKELSPPSDLHPFRNWGDTADCFLLHIIFQVCL